MMPVKFYKFIFSCRLVTILCSAAVAYDLQQGMHGMKWGSSISENAYLSKVYETALAVYYAKPNTFYQVSKQPIPGVYYGFYDDKFFAVLVKLRSPDQVAKLKQAFDTKYGDAKSSFGTQS